MLKIYPRLATERLRLWPRRRVLPTIPGDDAVPLNAYLSAARRVVRSKVGAYRALLDWWT